MIRKKTARDFTYSSQEYQEILLRAPIGFFTSTPEGKFLDVNPAMARMFGYESPQEMIDTIEDISTQLYVDPGDREELIRLIEEHGHILNHEIRFLRKDGSFIWTSRNARAVCDPQGTVLFYQGFVTDITGQKRTEQELREANRLFEGILDGIPDIIGVQNRDYTIVRYNKAGYEALGLSHDEAAGNPCYSLIGRSTPCTPCATARALKSGQLETVEMFVPELDRNLVCRSNPILDDNGEIGLIIEQLHDITERKRAEEALQESEERYKSLVEKSFAGVYVVQNGHFVFINGNAASFAGHKPDELIGRRADSIVHPDDRDGIKERVRNMLLSQDSLPHEFRIVTKAGQIRWIMETVSPIHYNGNPAILGNSMDVTEQRKAEAERREALDALQEVRKLEKGILQSVPHALFGVEERRIFFANDAIETVFGWKPEEFIGKSTRLIFRTDEEWIEYGTILYSRLEKEPVVIFEWDIPFVRKDGSEFFCRMSVSRIGAELGDARRIVATFEDITERRLAEAALAHSHSLMRYIIEHNRSAVAVHDKNLNYIYVSQRYLDDYKVAGRNIVGKHHYEVFPDLPQKWKDAHQKALSGEILRAEDDPYEREDGTVDWTRWECRPWYEADGSIGGIIVYTEVTTDRKRAELEKLELQRRLARAQKLESIGTLAGGIAHDINNLLMGIQGNVSLAMLDLDPSHPHRERLKHVEEHVASGASLTKQLLGFARGGRYEVKTASMNDIIGKVSDMFGRTRKEISIHRDYAKDPCIVAVDGPQMEQVFMNLFVNAWHAMPGGGDLFTQTETVMIDEDRASAGDVMPGWYVKVNVTDTGTGMDEQTKERMFDPFFTTKAMGRGTGLGLATVYGIIKGHGGMINVYSEPGHGTTFSLYLPLSEMNLAEEDQPGSSLLRGTETILLVDDERMILDVNRDMLQSLGYRVHTVASGREAVALFAEKKNEIDLVILDMIMPGISGSETFDQLREIKADVKILLSSGYSLNGQAQTIMDRGCDGFIQKPFQLEQLSQRVREMLD